MNTHRARRWSLLPLQHLPLPSRSHSHSRRIHTRSTFTRLATLLTNKTIDSINLLSKSFSSSESTFALNCNNTRTMKSTSRNPSLSASSSQAAQQHLFDQCRSFLNSRPPGECGVDDAGATHSFYPDAYTDPSTAVPLQADRVSLPEQAGAVPLFSVLPPPLVDFYSDPSKFLSPTASTAPQRPGRVAYGGSRLEYVKLVKRLLALDMVAVSAEVPRCINNVFTVKKGDDQQRLIVDARTTNMLFVDSPHVELPRADSLAELAVPADKPLFTGKQDLADYYHNLALPAHLQTFFGLPPLRAKELGLPSNTPEQLVYPVCKTLPMGFSHSVFIAQQAHEHVLASRSSISRDDWITPSSDRELSGSRVRVLVYIDDVIFVGLDQGAVLRAMQDYEHAMQSVGLRVKLSKRVLPTSDPVEALGLTIDGRRHTLAVSPAKLWPLLDATHAFCQQKRATGTQLRVLLGKWVWAMLVNRPSLACLNAVYRFVEVAQHRRFSLWPSVRAELEVVMGLAPLLSSSLCSEFSSRVVATDASDLGQGVVVAHVPRRVARVVASAGAPVVEDFTMRARWRVVISSAWRRAGEHINCLEARAVDAALRWLLSHPSYVGHPRGKRFLVLSDSSVVVGALRKGRSPSPALLRRLRSTAALLLASNTRLTLQWIRTSINPADEPSRLNQAEA